MYSKFFKNEVSEANESFLNADGWNNAFGDENADGDYDDSDGNYENADGYEDLQMENADGRRKPRAAESQPYIVSVQNTSTSTAASNVEILKALTRQFKLNSGVDSTQANLLFSYNIGSMTYDEFLAWIASGNVFAIGQTSLEAVQASGSTSIERAQVTSTIKITTKDPNGNEVARVFNPRVDSYQYQTTQTDIKHDYYVNSFTSLIVTTLYANTTLKLYFYPKAKVNQFKSLKTGVTTKYRNPGTSPALSARR